MFKSKIKQSIEELQIAISNIDNFNTDQFEKINNLVEDQNENISNIEQIIISDGYSSLQNQINEIRTEIKLNRNAIEMVFIGLEDINSTINTIKETFNFIKNESCYNKKKLSSYEEDFEKIFELLNELDNKYKTNSLVLKEILSYK